MAAILVRAKVSVFCSKIKKTFPKSSQWFYLAQTLIKHKKTQPKQRLDKLFITNRSKRQGIKIKLACPPTSAIVSRP